MAELRKAVPAIRVSCSPRARAPVRVQFLGKGVAVYPEFAVAPGSNHVTIDPPGYDGDLQLWSSWPHPRRFVTVEKGFWYEGGFYLMPENLPENLAVSP